MSVPQMDILFNPAFQNENGQYMGQPLFKKYNPH